MRFYLLLVVFLNCFWGYSQDSLKEQELEEVNIHLSQEKEITFEDNKHFILDFYIGERGNYILLKKHNNYFISSLDVDFKKENTLQLEFKPKKIFYDCFGFLHIVSRDSIYQIEKINSELLIFESNPIDLYDSFLKGCIANNSTQLIFKRLENFNQTTTYYGINKTSSKLTDLYQIEDPLLIHSAQDTYDSLVYYDPGATAILSEVSGYDLEQTKFYDFIHDHTESKNFFEQIVTLPDYHPIFVKRDTTYLFDYLNDLVVVMNDTGFVYRKISISSIKNLAIEFDKKLNRFYSVDQENGAQVYGLLSSNNFKVIHKTKITKHAYPEKVTIYNGYAYYLYKEFMNDNLNKLYRQKI